MRPAKAFQSQSTAELCIFCIPSSVCDRKHFDLILFLNYYVTVTCLMMPYSMFVRSSCRLIAHDLNLNELEKSIKNRKF